MADFKSGYAPVDGLEIYYEIHGKGEPLVLLHGGGDTIETDFAELIPFLAPKRKVIAFERQGYGRTADIDRPFSFEQAAQDTVGLLRHLGIPKADLLGFSNGGQVALQAALRHPEAVRRLVLQSTFFNRGACDPAFWEGFKHAKPDDMPAELKRAYLKKAPDPARFPVFFYKCVKLMLDFKGWTEEEIASIQAPALVLIGDRDIVKPEHALGMSRLIAHSRLAVLPDTDHMSMPRRAGWAAPMVEAFLGAPVPQANSK